MLLARDFNQLDLKSLCGRFNMKRLVHESTHGRNTLNQILTNMASLYDPAVHLPLLGKFDHQCLHCLHKLRVSSRIHNVHALKDIWKISTTWN